MKLILTSMFMLCQYCLWAQPGVKPIAKKYLLVRIWYDVDKANQQSFYKIVPDGWCDGANEIYGLKTYSTRRNAANQEAALYFERADTSKIFYNYFRSPTEAFNYMLNYGWHLSTAFPDNSGDAGDQPNTLVSRQVFCFYKE